MTNLAYADVSNFIGALKKITTDAKRLYVPISGGSDSALTYWLLNQAAPEKTIGIHIVKFNEPYSLRCRDWFEANGEARIVEMPKCQAGTIEDTRWMALLSYASGHSIRHDAKYTGVPAEPGWLVGCRNRTEDVLGTYSLASRLASFLPIVSLWRTQVLQMATLVGVPEEIIQSSLAPDPECGRPAEMAEIPPDLVDKFCDFFIDQNKWTINTPGITAQQHDYLLSIYNKNRFKAKLPLRLE